jgi:hypothetical protein
MASAIKKSVANLKRKLGQIEDPKVRKGVTDALRQVQKVVMDDVMDAMSEPGVPWI